MRNIKTSSRIHVPYFSEDENITSCISLSRKHHQSQQGEKASSYWTDLTVAETINPKGCITSAAQDQINVRHRLFYSKSKNPPSKQESISRSGLLSSTMTTTERYRAQGMDAGTAEILEIEEKNPELAGWSKCKEHLSLRICICDAGRVASFSATEVSLKIGQLTESRPARGRVQAMRRLQTAEL